MEIGFQDIVTGVVMLIVAIPTTYGIVDKRRKDLTQLWKDLYDAKVAESNEDNKHIVKLEARVDMLESRFVNHLAKTVAAEVVKELRGTIK